ncbi:putative impact protein [Alternaria alternata]|nr:putative impact protein [Alternaria alternata]
MTSAQDVQILLRFLSQDAKVPLAQALSKVKDLQAASLNTPSDLSNSSHETLKSIFADEKVARQVLNAAKRQSKKRSADTSSVASAPTAKRAKPTYGQPLNGADLEASLALPEPELDEKKVGSAVVYTNRAPLVLTFAVTLLKFTMPGQPISSRLSLAQAVTSMNSKSKAVHIGIDKDQPAEEEGWGEGQPLLRIMTREVRVMKRWGYEWEGSDDTTQQKIKSEPDVSHGEKEENKAKKDEVEREREIALWGVDLEALRKAQTSRNGSSNLPIYPAQSARAYLMKAFETPAAEVIKTEDVDVKIEGQAVPKPKGKRTAAVIAAEKEHNLSLLLGALELLYESWAKVLDKDDLDKRAWGWYVRVRPDVAQGAAGWGGKGNVKLSDILALRRLPS